MSDENGPGVITSLLPLVVWSIIPLIPAISICRRTGKTRWWAVLAVLPPFLGLIIFLFVFAYSRWTVTPNLDTEVKR